MKKLLIITVILSGMLPSAVLACGLCRDAPKFRYYDDWYYDAYHWDGSGKSIAETTPEEDYQRAQAALSRG